MPVRMTEIPPQTSNGATKIGVAVVDIAAETSFDAELELLTPPPVEGRTESREFAQVGQILRNMLPREVQITEQEAEDVSLDVEPQVDEPIIAMAKPDALQQNAGTKTTKQSKAELNEMSVIEPQTTEAVPLRPAVDIKMPIRTSTSDIPESTPISTVPVMTIKHSQSQASQHPSGQMSDVKPVAEQTAERPQISEAQRIPPAPREFISSKRPEPKLQITTDVHHDFSEVGAGTSDKPQILRTLPTAIPTVQPATTQPQPAETKIISQISTAISVMAKDTVEIRLDPPELGRVLISITQSESGLSATVISEKPEVADLLRRHSELLSRELAKSGFGEASLEFSHRDQRQGRSVFEEDTAQYSTNSPEPSEAISSIESILQSHSGSLDIRL